MSDDITDNTPPEFDTLLAALPDRHRLFVLGYLDTLNQTKAAELAGVAHPRSNAWRLMANDGVRAAIDAGFAARGMGKAEIIARYTEMGRADIGEFLKFDSEGVPVWFDLEGAPTHLIKKIKITKVTRNEDDAQLVDHKIELELHDAKAALDSLSKVLGVEKAQAAAGVVLTVTPAELREMSDEEIDELARKRGLL